LLDYITACVTAGVTGVTETNLTAVNLAVVGVERDDAETMAEIQTLVKSVIAQAQDAALEKVADYAEDSSGPGTVPTVADYATAGVTGVSAATPQRAVHEFSVP